ncbi:MAG TPA: hypothetical protein DCR93_14845 [Cytophagales bacterium]|nr:hypothetical protein [Cytophagales bacterium]
MVKRMIHSAQMKTLLSQVISASASLVAFALLANHLAPTELGTWGIYLVALAFFDMLRIGLIRTPLIKVFQDTPSHNRNDVIGTGWALGVLFSGALSMLVLFVPMTSWVPESFSLFTTHFPWVYLASLPYSMGIIYQEAQGNFKTVLALRTVFSLLYLGVAVATWWVGLLPASMVVLHGAALGLAGLLFLPKTGIRHVPKANQQRFSQLFQLGKYTTLNLLGTYLLKSLDVLLLGVWLGPAAVGVYHVAMKWMEVAEIFVRSFSTAALPQLGQRIRQKNYPSTRAYFHRMVAYQYLLILPILLGIFLLAPWLVRGMAGSGYQDAVPLVRLFCLASFWLPIDRFLGITLDMIGQPRKNTVKILAMVLLNGLGDVWVLQASGSLWGVVLVTLANVLLGVVLGYYFLRPYIQVSFLEILRQVKQSLHRMVQQTLSLATS